MMAARPSSLWSLSTLKLRWDFENRPRTKSMGLCSHFLRSPLLSTNFQESKWHLHHVVKVWWSANFFSASNNFYFKGKHYLHWFQLQPKRFYPNGPWYAMSWHPLLRYIFGISESDSHPRFWMWAYKAPGVAWVNVVVVTIPVVLLSSTALCSIDLSFLFSMPEASQVL